jgi:hypothetical protein
MVRRVQIRVDLTLTLFTLLLPSSNNKAHRRTARDEPLRAELVVEPLCACLAANLHLPQSTASCVLIVATIVYYILCPMSSTLGKPGRDLLALPEDFASLAATDLHAVRNAHAE